LHWAQWYRRSKSATTTAGSLRVDFLYEQQRTVVEFDGLVKYSGADGREALVAEKRREDRLRDLGFQVVRVTLAELDRPILLQHRIQAAFARTTAAERSS